MNTYKLTIEYSVPKQLVVEVNSKSKNMSMAEQMLTAGRMLDFYGEDWDRIVRVSAVNIGDEK